MSLLKQDYREFEIIVLAINTHEYELWEPVERYCKGFSNVTFLHKEEVEGYKAGALNMCRELMSNDAEYIFTVDADCALVEGCLSEAVSIAQKYRVTLIQFLKAYWGASNLNQDIEGECKPYFKIHPQGNSFNRAALSTNTLSLIKVNALDAIGGWPPSTSTAGNELGEKLETLDPKNAEIKKGSLYNL